jgi:Xaa-Pro aminopeptidase
MQRLRLIAALSILLLFGSCRESPSDSPVDATTAFPTKLYPYEVTYDSATFRQRRDALVNSMTSGSIALVTTNDVYLRNGDIDYDFRPSSTFYYLTGFEEPNAVAVIRRGSGTASEMIMFVEERDSRTAQWMGSTYGPAGAVIYFGADSAYGFAALSGALRAYLGSGAIQEVYANLEDNGTVEGIFISAGGGNLPVTDINSIVDGMRVIKDAREVALLKRGVDVSVQAFSEGIMATEPSMYEYEVESVFDLVLRLNGCPRTAFGTIVASGPNITTIHYTANRRRMQSGDLAMIDFGAEYGYYAADLTRTIPVNGTFTAEQAAVYDFVLKSIDSVIAAAKPGANFWTLSYMANVTMVEGLLAKGIITGNKDAIMSSSRYLQYIPAGMGHPIGLDVHDPFPVDRTGRRFLREGMVLAVEPGLYLQPDDTTVAQAYRGICVRIEDDIRISATGCEVLSSQLPRTRAGIEELMRRR